MVVNKNVFEVTRTTTPVIAIKEWNNITKFKHIIRIIQVSKENHYKFLKYHNVSDDKKVRYQES